MTAIGDVVERHNPGPYPADELAILAGVTPADVQKVLDRMVADGTATPPTDTQETDPRKHRCGNVRRAIWGRGFGGE
ncbi:hypothetical protein F1D05_25585 [Kribbella qitaiheensis]|uniref:Uncharacterized protein n=1 Tax=Kribbella qitaiheensis TaxID=1544730 RepID=A0A7G6X352_9ACTN|nr:hypothetical protein [Kribbella qitaiheensis]QNE20667.1 hypothetical protein F1D05_25585 [Kribbella qitaiheensis]